ncbi:MAG: cache domain-containing protein [Anaerolineales bacterium]
MTTSVEPPTNEHSAPQPRARWFRRRRRLRLRQAGLRTQLLLSTALPAALLMIAVATAGLRAFTRVTQQLVEDRDAELVALSASQVADHWAETLLLLSQVAATDEIRGGDPVSAKQILTANDALLRRFDALLLTDASGSVLASTLPTPLDSLGSQPVFQGARDNRRAVRSGLLSSDQGEQFILVAVPVYDQTRRFGGCLVGVWRLGGEGIAAPLRLVRAGSGAFAYLVDGDGRVLWHPQASLVGADMSQHPAVIKALAGQSGAETVQERSDTVVVGYSPIPANALNSSLFSDPSWQNWTLLVSERWEDITSPFRPLFALVLVLIVGLGVLPLLVLAISSQRVIAPLQTLVAQVDRVASGEFSTQVSIDHGPSEVHNLEVKFNDMVEQLRRYQADIQNYVTSVINSQEEERKRIARELHDETAQTLIVLGRRIEDAQEHCTDPELAASLSELRDMVDDTLRGVRRFTSDLRPPLLEELGLSNTIEILGSRTAREDNLDVAVEIIGEPKPLPPEHELALYRLAQESLSNVRRHASASHVDLILRYEADQVTLSITDNGIGFDVPPDTSALVAGGRLGLMGIYERARLLGGTAKISSTLGQGTSVDVTLPIDNPS